MGRYFLDRIRQFMKSTYKPLVIMPLELAALHGIQLWNFGREFLLWPRSDSEWNKKGDKKSEENDAKKGWSWPIWPAKKDKRVFRNKKVLWKRADSFFSWPLHWSVQLWPLCCWTPAGHSFRRTAPSDRLRETTPVGIRCETGHHPQRAHVGRAERNDGEFRTAKIRKNSKIGVFYMYFEFWYFLFLHPKFLSDSF